MHKYTCKILTSYYTWWVMLDLVKEISKNISNLLKTFLLILPTIYMEDVTVCGYEYPQQNSKWMLMGVSWLIGV